MPARKTWLATPVFGNRVRNTRFSNGWKVVDATHREAMADVTSQAFLSSQVGIVLGSCRLEHGRAKIGRVAEVLGEGIVSQEGPTTRKPSSNVGVTSFVP